MQQAVLKHFPEVQAVYKFTHRDNDVCFSRPCYDLFVESISRESASVVLYDKLMLLQTLVRLLSRKTNATGLRVHVPISRKNT